MARASSSSSSSCSSSISGSKSSARSSSPPSSPGIQHLDLDHLLTSTSAEDFSKRRRLLDVSTAIAKAKKVVVVSGAGISCSSGIPDFRSENGLYSLVKKRFPDTFVTGKDLFSSGLFSNPATTAVFLSFIAELSLSCQKAIPTRTHHFIQKLDRTGKLLRSYTQNVDGFERRLGMESGGRGAGLSKAKTKNVELHGDLGRVRCTLCMTDYPAKSEWVEAFREGEAPDCPACQIKSADRLNRGQRGLRIGTLRPSIVLYDEPHPLGDEIGELNAHDLRRVPDVLLIMGTSLKVHGLKALVKNFAKSVHSNPKKKGLVVFVNQTRPGKEWEGVIDVHIQGQTDVWVEKVEEEWRRVRPGDWEVQTVLDGAVVVPGPAAEGKPAAKAARGKTSKAPIMTSGQLPTPRPSKSPSRLSTTSPPKLPPASDKDHRPQLVRPLSPLSPPPSPLSPSKRRANLQTPSPSDSSPAKKTRPGPAIPHTGIPGTPGQGNLFASPSKPTASAAAAGGDRRIMVVDLTNSGSEDDEARDEWEDVFGSPRKAPLGEAKQALKIGGSAAKGRKGLDARPKKNGEDEKENTPIKAQQVKVKGRAKGVVMRAGNRQAVDRRRELRVAA